MLVSVIYICKYREEIEVDDKFKCLNDPYTWGTLDYIKRCKLESELEKDVIAEIADKVTLLSVHDVETGNEILDF